MCGGGGGGCKFYINFTYYILFTTSEINKKDKSKWRRKEKEMEMKRIEFYN